MRGWDRAAIVAAAGASIVEPGRDGPGPVGATVDSRAVSGGELFVGLRGARTDGGVHALNAIRAGAWGVLVTPAHAEALLASGELEAGAGAAVLAHAEPLAGLQSLARSWRRELGSRGAKLVAITGSTGKTSTKDILAALIAPYARTVASPQNFNTEIGLPLAVLSASADTEVVILEMAMRGTGQIAELTAIAEPDVGVIVNVGPAHLELLGSLEAIAAAKAELIAGLAPASTIVIPAREPLLAPHLRDDLQEITFGEGGDVVLESQRPGGEVLLRHGARRIALRPSFAQAHQLVNLLAAVAAARALGITPQGRLDVRFSALRGDRLTLPGAVVLIDDCYNANPMSMRAAIDELAETSGARRVAVLGDMLELGDDAPRMHREIGLHATARGIDLLITAGPLAEEIGRGFGGEAYAAADAPAAAELLRGLLCEYDTVLIKGSRGVGLERVAQILGAAPALDARAPVEAVPAAVPGAGAPRG